MICPNCCHERFHIIIVYRNRRMKEGKWVANDKIDTRLISCEKCGQRYLTETIITHRLKYSNYKAYIENIKENTQSEIKFDE